MLILDDDYFPKHVVCRWKGVIENASIASVNVSCRWPSFRHRREEMAKSQDENPKASGFF